MGLPPEAIAKLRARGEQEEEAFEIWPENRLVLEAFLSVSTQWRAIAKFDGGAYFQGLDYAGAVAGLGAAGIALSPPQWADLRVMEAAARNRLNGIVETGL